jgi:uncharacterized membrane protein
MIRTTRFCMAAIGATVAFVSGTALAQQHPEKPTYPYEKCYGVAAAGKNDCFTARNSCAGTTSADSEPQAWVYLPKGTCERIVGGLKTPER